MTPAHFTFGWGYALLVGAGIQKKYCRDESKQPDALFSIHRRSRYCGKTRSNKILFKYEFSIGTNPIYRLAHCSEVPTRGGYCRRI
jgi:hypothetical protein